MADLVICIRQSSPFEKEAKKWSTKKIAVEDPYMPKRNLARSVNSQLVFEFIMDRLRDGVKYFGTPPHSSSNKQDQQIPSKNNVRDTGASESTATDNKQAVSADISGVHDGDVTGEKTQQGKESVGIEQNPQTTVDSENIKAIDTCEGAVALGKESVKADKPCDQTPGNETADDFGNQGDIEMTDRAGTEECSTFDDVGTSKADVEIINSSEAQSAKTDDGENSKMLSFTTQGASDENTELTLKSTSDEDIDLTVHSRTSESEYREESGQPVPEQHLGNVDKSKLTQQEDSASFSEDINTAHSGESTIINSTSQCSPLDEDMKRLQINNHTMPNNAQNNQMLQTKENTEDAGDSVTHLHQEQQACFDRMPQESDHCVDKSSVVKEDLTSEEVVHVLLQDMLEKTLNDVEPSHSEDGEDEEEEEDDEDDDDDDDDDDYETVSEEDVDVAMAVADDEVTEDDVTVEHESESASQSGSEGVNDDGGNDGDDEDDADNSALDNDHGMKKEENIKEEMTIDDVTDDAASSTKVDVKSSSVEDTNDNALMEFMFDQKILTNGGKKPVIVCKSCKREGHSYQSCPDDRPPNLPKLPKLSAEDMRRIDHTCQQMIKIHAPNDIEVKIREEILRDLEKYIQKHIHDDAQLCLFGSSINGFGFQFSDLDICMTFKDVQTAEEMSKPAPEIIENLAGKIKKYNGLYGVVPIPTAKVPIVKFTLRRTQLEGDISLYNTLAQHNTRMLAAYADIDVRVKQLGYTIKVFAKICDIGDASRGSLSSYAYILMLLYFLQQRKPPVIPVLQELYSGKEKPQRIVDNWNAWFFDDIKNLGHIRKVA
ncbi:terminal uridylyltransferase 7-like [Ptychodera flava]|uniref:terminal uridylyltransferase 7-like n=1 Tax=Ptychodera flava TaxID=63121 RepID=UPI003969E517